MQTRDLALAARFAPPSVPAWAVPRSNTASDVEAAFMAGSALNSLDNIMRAAPSWAGAWRRRLALKSAAVAVAQVGRTEDEAQLRDAWHWRDAGTDAGPAGNLLAAWRRLTDRAPGISAATLRSIVGLLGLRWSDGFARLPDLLDELNRSGRPAPLVAAALMGEVTHVEPDAEILGWWLADLAIAARMRWPFAVPLLITQARSFAFRGAGSQRVRPGGEGFDRASCIALALAAAEACRLASDIAPRAEHLIAVTPKLRAKGAGEVIELLLDDDAVSGTLQTAKLTRWGARRLFDRLGHLNAIRELSGRASFRLYGL